MRLHSLLIFLTCLLLSISAHAEPKHLKDEIVAAVPASFPPYYYLNDQGGIEGFAIDIMDAIAKEAGLHLTYDVKQNWAGVFDAMKNNKAHLIPNVGKSEKRGEYLLFTDAIETFNISVFIRHKSQAVFKKLENLNGKKVGAVKTNIGHRLLLQNKQFEPFSCDTFEQCFYALVSAKIDAVIYPEPVAWKLLQVVGQEEAVSIVDAPLQEVVRVVGVNKEHPALVEKINDAIAVLIETKEYARIYNKWFSKAPSYWNITRIVLVISTALLLIFILVGVWRYIALNRHKQLLDREVRKRTEELDATNKLLQDVLNTIPARVFWKDIDNVYLGCNQSFANDAGVTGPSEVVGKTDFDFGWRDLADVYRADDSAVMKSGISKLNFEEPQTTPDGSRIWLQTSKIPLTNKANQTYGVLGVYELITERKEMEQALRKSQDSYLIAESLIHIGVWTWDIENNELSWSDEVFRMFGFEPQSRVPDLEMFKECVHPDDRAAVEAAILESIKSSEPFYDVEHRIVLPDGSFKVIHERALIHYQDGKAVTMTGMSHDITEQKQAERELVEARDVAENANRAKSEFLANMSHELRTPLHGILSYAQLGLKKMEKGSDPKLAKYFRQIDSSGERLKVLLNDLLDISKLEAGKMELAYETCNIKDIAESCLAEQTAVLDERMITAELTVEENVLACCDGNRIGQVLMNLLSNAIKFSPDQDVIKIDVKNNGQVLTVSVEDHGQGVAEEEREAIFEKFVQSKNTGFHHGGTGLGLAISKELINAHLGKIWCESGTSGGARFIFEIPVDHRAA